MAQKLNSPTAIREKLMKLKVTQQLEKIRTFSHALLNQSISCWNVKASLKQASRMSQSPRGLNIDLWQSLWSLLSDSWIVYLIPNTYMHVCMYLGYICIWEYIYIYISGRDKNKELLMGYGGGVFLIRYSNVYMHQWISELFVLVNINFYSYKVIFPWVHI